jgi:Damage-control phosphatase ARMT1-like domain
MAARLRSALDAARFVLLDHPFWVTGSFFHAMPDNLKANIAHADLVISKGDANYRRLIGDCHWDPAMPFKVAAGYFPVTLVALRTLKAELIVGLQAGEAERLQAQDPAWLVNGKRGVIQFLRK